TVDLLATDHDVVKYSLALTMSSDALSSLLDEMQLSIRPNGLNASARSRAVRIARSEAASSTKSEARFRRAMSTVEDLSRTRRASLWTDQARDHFKDMVADESAMQLAAGNKQAALDRFGKKKKTLLALLRGSFSVVPQGTAGVFLIVLNVMCLFAGAA